MVNNKTALIITICEIKVQKLTQRKES